MKERGEREGRGGRTRECVHLSVLVERAKVDERAARLGGTRSGGDHAVRHLVRVGAGVWAR